MPATLFPTTETPESRNQQKTAEWTKLDESRINDSTALDPALVGICLTSGKPQRLGLMANYLWNRKQILVKKLLEILGDESL